MSTALEQMHEIEPHVQVGRARAGVLMLILSDSLSVVAILAAGGYLNALNVEGQYLVSGDHGPAFLPSLLVAIALILSGLFFYLWARSVRKQAEASPPALVVLAFVLMVVALVIQVFIGLRLGFTNPPFHAYESLIILLTWYTSAHFLLSAIIGLLLVGRVLRGRVSGHSYIADVVGYWWYYTIVVSLILWAFGAIIR
jgi:cation transport ATPase